MCSTWNRGNTPRKHRRVSPAEAVTLNITQWYAVKKHGALMQNIIGNLNLVTVIAISKAILLEPWIPMDWLKDV